MGRKLRKATAVMGAAAVVCVAKAVKEFFEYKKLKNKDIYIDTELTKEINLTDDNKK